MSADYEPTKSNQHNFKTIRSMSDEKHSMHLLRIVVHEDPRQEYEELEVKKTENFDPTANYAIKDIKGNYLYVVFDGDGDFVSASRYGGNNVDQIIKALEPMHIM